MISRRDAREIVELVVREVRKRSSPYVTDGKVDLTKAVSAPATGTPNTGGVIADNAIYNRHIAEDAAIDIEKIDYADIALSFLTLLDTPTSYVGQHDQVATVNPEENGLIFKPIDYLEGGYFTSSYSGAVTTNLTEVEAGSFNENLILNGGTF